MRTKDRRNFRIAALLCALALSASVAQAADPLPSWIEGKAKQSIMESVAKVTKPGSPDFVPPEQVVGSSVKTTFEMRAGKPVLVPPARAHLHRRQGRQTRRNQPADQLPPDRRLRQLRRRPRDATVDDGGQWTALRARCPPRRRRPRVGLPPDSSLGKLDKGLDEAKANAWTVVSMKSDWRLVFPFEN